MSDCPTRRQNAATVSKNACSDRGEEGKCDTPKLSNKLSKINSEFSLSDDDEIIFFPFSRDRSFEDNVAACKVIIKATDEAMNVIENAYKALLSPDVEIPN
ncbi:hypothetical protein HNY73_010996 [Argiope bruennichi]|uniref:Uncharacterized protein n=1 Tax=Argiope bruennichi TaxID=94029 RepID=A0A8T0F5B8_ARGBR|nr:hypothetical protein HNY73_010996 [Argiope bruennichi]